MIKKLFITLFFWGATSTPFAKASVSDVVSSVKSVFHPSVEVKGSKDPISFSIDVSTQKFLQDLLEQVRHILSQGAHQSRELGKDILYGTAALYCFREANGYFRTFVNPKTYESRSWNAAAMALWLAAGTGITYYRFFSGIGAAPAVAPVTTPSA